MYKDLSKLDLGDKIIVDLGLVQQNEYYSGIVFTGYALGYGDAILSGGRYDKIFSEFNNSMGASGFAININHLAEEARYHSKSNIPEVLVFAKTTRILWRLLLIPRRLVKSGVRAQFSDLSDEKEARQFASKLGINKFEIIGE